MQAASNGVKVIHDHSTGLFHHKFCIIDGIIVATGSLNWTRQAVIGNYENVVIIKHNQTVRNYQNEYENIWKKIEKNMKLNQDSVEAEDWD